MKIKVGVFFGGKSVEHEVSIISALQAIKAIDEEKYEVVPIYISKDNKMYVGPFIGDITEYKDIDALVKKSTRVVPINNMGVVELVKFPKKILSNYMYDYIDVAFPIVHGTNVEDGTIEGYLKMANIPYVGCDVVSSAVCMDKFYTKAILKESSIPVLDAKVFCSFEKSDDIVKQIKEYPVIVKPINLGSSVGISKAKDEKSLINAIEESFKYSNKILIEKCITSLREINCSVLGDYEECLTSECEEPITSEDILTYEDKYISGNKGGKLKGSSKGMSSLKRRLPADISVDLKKEIQDLAIKTFKSLGCAGVVRIDFMVDTKINKVYVNELNTIPGSLSFYLWEASNIKYKELLDRLIKLALKRQREEDKVSFSIDTNILANVNLNGVKGSKGKFGKF